MAYSLVVKLEIDSMTHVSPAVYGQDLDSRHHGNRGAPRGVSAPPLSMGSWESLASCPELFPDL